MCELVKNKALAQCSMGTGPGAVMVLRPRTVKLTGENAGDDSEKGISACGNCTSINNPAVVAADGAPVPCTPMPATFKWDGLSTVVKMNGSPALLSGSTLKCYFGGKMSIVDAGQHYVHAKQ